MRDAALQKCAKNRSKKPQTILWTIEHNRAWMRSGISFGQQRSPLWFITSAIQHGHSYVIRVMQVTKTTNWTGQRVKQLLRQRITLISSPKVTLSRRISSEKPTVLPVYGLTSYALQLSANQVGRWSELWAIKSLGYEEFNCIHVRTLCPDSAVVMFIHDGTSVYQPACRYTHDRGKSFRIQRYAVGAPPVVGTKYCRVCHIINGCSQKFKRTFFED